LYESSTGIEMISRGYSLNFVIFESLKFSNFL
jgi:hypothetical protein